MALVRMLKNQTTPFTGFEWTSNSLPAKMPFSPSTSRPNGRQPFPYRITEGLPVIRPELGRTIQSRIKSNFPNGTSGPRQSPAAKWRNLYVVISAFFSGTA
jgi:hypothetical protein